MRSHPAESDLNLVGQADAACLPDPPVNVLKVSVGKNDLPSAAEEGFGDESGREAARRRNPVETTRDGVRVFPGGLWIIRPV